MYYMFIQFVAILTILVVIAIILKDNFTKRRSDKWKRLF